MGSLLIRDINDESLAKLKKIAKKQHRSTEAEARSLVEDFTAGLLVSHEVEETNFYDELRAYMEKEGIKGIDDFELPLRTETAEPMTFEE
ncbi:MAG: hypothetical protein J6575_04640 [Bifidobacterium sp.]|nr:hypothetical protein [Bifidobacterium sp.]